LSALGVGRGDRVLLVLKNRAEHVLAYWALQRIAAVATPVNFRLAAGELAYLLADSGARVVVFEAATAGVVLEGGRAHRDVSPVGVVPAGEKGEIIARLDSPEAFTGYWSRPDADARALRQGWYFTGDMGYLDADGELYVAGRVD